MAHGWKSAGDRERYLGLYREIKDRAGIAPIEREVATDLGATRVYEWPGEGAPIALLHGAATNVAMWQRVLPALPGRHLIGFDMPGEPGESTLEATVDSVDDLVRWIGQAMTAAGAERVHLVGASYGGWVALSFALAHPERVLSLTMVEPALDRVQMGRFMRHGIASGVAMALPGPLRTTLAKRLHVREIADDPKMRKLGVMGFRLHKRDALPKPVPVSDDELAALAVSTRVVLAAASPMHDTAALAQRIAAANPSVAVEVIANAGHTLPYEQAELVADRIRMTAGL